MDFIIWGAGVRGRQALNFLGMEQVCGFIDRNVELQKRGFCGKPVVDFETYKKFYWDSLLVISFLEFDEAVRILEQEKIYTFLLLDDIIY